MKGDTFSYEDFLRVMQTSSDVTTPEQVNGIIERFESPHSIPSHHTPVVYVLDYARNQYIYVSEACFDLFGYTAKQWVAEGIMGFLSKWHPSDYQIMNSYVFPENMKYLQSVPLESYSNLIFSFNYRVLNAKGEYITILQRSSYIPGTVEGKPRGSIGVAFDITHFKSDIQVIHTIEEVKKMDGRTYNELVFKKTYVPRNDSYLSKREVEILSWMAEGLSSKQIAERLSISINTVNNHRKNMLQRTGSKSSTELLSYALKHGFL